MATNISKGKAIKTEEVRDRDDEGEKRERESSNRYRK